MYYLCVAVKEFTLNRCPSAMVGQMMTPDRGTLLRSHIHGAIPE
jgi:hypothetical protein